jgi:hypothetical protein
MGSLRRHGLGLLVGGAVLFALPAVNVARPPANWQITPGCLMVYLGTGWLLGGILAARGCRVLQEAKRQRPDRGWVEFLRGELVVLGLVVALMVGLALLPEGARESIVRALQQAQEALQAARR